MKKTTALINDNVINLEEKEHAIRRVSKNFLFLLIARIIDAGSQFLTISLVSRYLGASQYGNFGYVVSFAFLTVSFTYLGLEIIATREISKDINRSGQFLGASIIIRWFYAAIGWLFMTGIIFLLKLPSDIFIPIYITNLALNFMGESSLYFALFKAHEKMGYETFIAGVYQSLNVGAILIVKYFDMGFTSLFIGFLIANIIRNILCFIIAWRKFLPPNFKLIFPISKFLVKGSYTICLFILINQAFVYVDLFILKAFKNTYEVSMFYGPHNFFSLLNIIPAALMVSIFPSLSRAASTNVATLTYGFEKSFKILVLSTLFIIILFVIYANQFVMIFFGKEFQGAIQPFQILAIGLIFIVPFHAIQFTIVSINKQNILILCPLFSLLLRVILNLIMVPKFGYIGASIAATSGYFLYFLTGLFFINKFVDHQPIYKLLSRPIVASLLTALCVYPFNKTSIFIMAPIGLVIYAASLTVTKSFSNDESQFIKILLKKAMSTLSGKIGLIRNTMR